MLKRDLPRVQEGVLEGRVPWPVSLKQRRYGEEGDCWATAVASYAGLGTKERNELHRRILISDARVRQVGKDPREGGNWWNVTMRFLWEHNLPSLGQVYDDINPTWIYIASGPGPRDYEHAILAYGGGEVFSDPHPDETGLLEVTDWIGWWTP